jgi:hypothetical protein
MVYKDFPYQEYIDYYLQTKVSEIKKSVIKDIPQGLLSCMVPAHAMHTSPGRG